MSKLSRCPPRMLLTPSRALKLYGAPLLPPAERVARGVALTWICDPTDGFVRADRDDPRLAVYWWEERTLRRLRCEPSAPSRRPDLDALTVSPVDEWPILAFEAAFWTRYVLKGRPPAIASYLPEFHV